MSKLQVFDAAGAAVGEYEVDDAALVTGRGGQTVKDAVTAIRAGRRAGTASTLSKAEVAGSNRKPWRQKGTGQARSGYRRSPVWRGGGVVFGPKPRSYEVKLQRRQAKLAFIRALSDRIAEGAVRVVQDLALPGCKTKAFVAVLKALKVSAPAVIVVERPERNVVLASRNVPGVELVTAQKLSVYHVVRYPVLVATRAAMEVLKGRLTAGGKGDA